jgi:hypothetical protein
MGVTIAFRRSDLQEAFFVPGTHPFRVWGYGTTDPLEQVLAPGYFEHGRGLVCPGELIYVSTTPRDAGGSGRNEARLALVMVGGDGRGAASVRLVQDFGSPRSGGHPQLTCVTSAGRRADAGQARPRPPARQQDQEAGRRVLSRAAQGQDHRGANARPKNRVFLEFPRIFRAPAEDSRRHGRVHES